MERVYLGLAGGEILRPGERLAKPPWARGGAGGRRTCFQPGICRRLTGCGMADLSKGDDLGGQGGRVEQSDRALAPEPAPGLAGVNDQDPVSGFDQGPVSMAEDHNVGRFGLDEPVNEAVPMADDQAQPPMNEGVRLLPDLAQPLEGPGQAGPLPVAVAEDGPYGGLEVPELVGRKGGDEVPGVDDQVATGVIEQADGLPDAVQVVVGVRQDTDHLFPYYSLVRALGERPFRPKTGPRVVAC